MGDDFETGLVDTANGSGNAVWTLGMTEPSVVTEARFVFHQQDSHGHIFAFGIEAPNPHYAGRPTRELVRWHCLTRRYA